MIISITLLVVQLASSLAANFTACHLPTGSPGLCVPIGQCGHLTSLLANLQSPLPKDVALIIRESFFCEVKNGAVHVCCPVEGITSSRSQADILGIVISYLKNPLPPLPFSLSLSPPLSLSVV